MAEAKELILRLAETRALSEMERDLHQFLTERRLHGTIHLQVPPEIYSPTVTPFLESDVFHKTSYPIQAGDVNLGSITIWSYRPIESPQAQEIETYLYPWLMGFRRRLMSNISQGNFFGRKNYTAAEVDFFRRRIWYEIERGKRYNVFLTYYRVDAKLSKDIHEERIGDGLKKILRLFEPAICFLENARVDFLKIGQAAAAAERFLPEIQDAFRGVGCEARTIRRLTFPKDFFEYEEFLQKTEL